MITFAIPFPDIGPNLVDFGFFAIRWYALAYIVGLLMGWRYLAYMCNKPTLWPQNKAPITAAKTEDLLIWMILGVMLGGRVGYVLFYDFASFMDNPLNIFKIWEGGMSFHGGFIGVITAGLLFARKYKAPILSLGDGIACCAPIGILFGRIANFTNGELWGRTTDVPWAVIFPHGGPDPRHPSQIYEALLEGALLFILLYIVSRVLNGFKRPGLCIGIFMLVYGAARSFVENFREPDAHIGFIIPIGDGGLTMGMLLSTPMYLVGIYLVVNALRKKPA